MSKFTHGKYNREDQQRTKTLNLNRIMNRTQERNIKWKQGTSKQDQGKVAIERPLSVIARMTNGTGSKTSSALLNRSSDRAMPQRLYEINNEP